MPALKALQTPEFPFFLGAFSNRVGQRPPPGMSRCPAGASPRPATGYRSPCATTAERAAVLADRPGLGDRAPWSFQIGSAGQALRLFVRARSGPLPLLNSRLAGEVRENIGERARPATVAAGLRGASCLGASVEFAGCAGAGCPGTRRHACAVRCDQRSPHESLLRSVGRRRQRQCRVPLLGQRLSGWSWLCEAPCLNCTSWFVGWQVFISHGMMIPCNQQADIKEADHERDRQQRQA